MTGEETISNNQIYDFLLKFKEETDQRLTKLETRMDALETRMDALETRMDALETRMDALEQKLEKQDHRISNLEFDNQSIKQTLKNIERTQDRDHQMILELWKDHSKISQIWERRNKIDELWEQRGKVKITYSAQLLSINALLTIIIASSTSILLNNLA